MIMIMQDNCIYNIVDAPHQQIDEYSYYNKRARIVE